jgi:hypothetical protein
MENPAGLNVRASDGIKGKGEGRVVNFEEEEDCDFRDMSTGFKG